MKTSAPGRFCLWFEVCGLWLYQKVKNPIEIIGQEMVNPKLKMVRYATILLVLFISGFSNIGRAQQVDSLFFNLYTDSLKKGVYNYINVDGKLSDGRWLPLTAKELSFTASGGRFEGNCLVIDTGFKAEKVTVKAVLKNNPSVWRETTIYIKKVEVVERLRTVDEILNTPSSRRNKRNRG